MKQIIINCEQLQTRIAVSTEGRLDEYQVEHRGEERIVGSIYKGRIRNLEASLQAAFVDIGMDKNAFLHYWDMVPATEEMLGIALRHKPHAACIVPEKRQERTTEGGLDAAGGVDQLAPYVTALKDAGIRVSLFIEPDQGQLEAAVKLGAPVVELHTGAYCEAKGEERERQFRRIDEAARTAEELKLECHAGHGLTFDTVGAVAAIPTIIELNIGHFLIGEAIFGGLESAIKRMRALMDKARAEAGGERSA